MVKGERFGKLVFSGERQITGSGRSLRVLWRFDCDCGGVRWCRPDQVSKRGFKTCGCGSRNHLYKERQKAMGTDYPFWVLLNVFRKNAKTRNLEFTIELEHLKDQWERQSGKCFYTGEALTMPENFLKIGGPSVASIDRTDNAKGYIPGNIQLVTKRINLMKQCMSHQEFVETCEAVACWNALK